MHATTAVATPYIKWIMECIKERIDVECSWEHFDSVFFLLEWTVFSLKMVGNVRSAVLGDAVFRYASRYVMQTNCPTAQFSRFTLSENDDKLNGSVCCVQNEVRPNYTWVKYLFSCSSPIAFDNHFSSTRQTRSYRHSKFLIRIKLGVLYA